MEALLVSLTAFLAIITSAGVGPTDAPKVYQKITANLAQEVKSQRANSRFPAFSEFFFVYLGQTSLQISEAEQRLSCPDFRDYEIIITEKLARAQVAINWLTNPDFKERGIEYEVLLQFLANTDKDLDAIPKKLEKVPDDQWLVKLGARKVSADLTRMINNARFRCLGSPASLDNAFIELSEIRFLKEKLEKTLENY